MTTPVLERYVDVRELAELMGVSVRTVKRWVAEGIPSETWGLGRTRRFLPSRAMEWAQTRGAGPMIERDHNRVRRMTTVEPHREE